MATYNLNRIKDPNGNVYIVNGTPNQYGTCSTTGSTAAKTVTVANSGFVLEAGARVSVKFTYSNSASSPTLNVNSKGAKNIYHKGVRITSGGNKALLAGIVDFIYDGTQWHLVGNYIDTTGGSSSDTKVTQAYSTTNNVYPILMTATAGNTSTSSRGATTAIVNNQIYANPSVGMLRAYNIGGEYIEGNRADLINGVIVADSYTTFFGDYDSMPDDVAYSSCDGYPVIQGQYGTPGIIMRESEQGTETLYQFPANNGANTVVSTVGTVGQYIKVVDNLPSSPDANTLYFIK